MQISPSVFILQSLHILFIHYSLCRLPSLVPLAGAVHRLLEVVVHYGGIAGAVEAHGAALQSVLTAALAEARVAVDVKVEYGGRWAFPIAGVDGHLRGRRGGYSEGNTSGRDGTFQSVCNSLFCHTGALLLQSSFLMVVRIATRLQVLPSSLPACRSDIDVRVKNAGMRFKKTQSVTKQQRM